MIQPLPSSTLFPYTTLFRSALAPLQPVADRCYAVFGNHDHEAPHEVRHGLAANGIRLLKTRSEEHTSELQSQFHLVCRLLLEKKKALNDTNRLGLAAPADSRSDYVPPPPERLPRQSCRYCCNDPATTQLYTLSLHDALPICLGAAPAGRRSLLRRLRQSRPRSAPRGAARPRGERHPAAEDEIGRAHV